MPKSIYILFFLCALGAKADAQSLSQNYVLGKQMLDTEGTRAITSVTYYDGLGYPVETATNGLGGTGKYAYTLLEYDLPGRTKREWLAGAIGSDCSFVPSSELSSSLTAYHKDQNPYTVKESDVLDREASILGPGEHLCSAYYHDIRGLVVKSRQTKLGDILLSQDVTYSFTKKPLVITSTIQRGKVCKSVIQTNTYNRYNDQLATIGLQAGGSERVIASYAYDDVGKLVNIGRSGSAGNIRKEYNVRGWLQSIKTPRFSESLSYETQAAHPRYDGNVSRLQWQSGKDNILRGYDFEYDDLNRLTDSYYAEGTGMSQNKDHYSEKGIEYSSNGCIEKMQRYGRKNDNTFGLIDDLSYLYNGNQVKSISDKAGSLVYNGSFDFKDGASASTEYSYNVNGAIVKDLNKGINGIEYDVLGNLNSITFGNGFKTKYVYDAIGNKLQTTHVGAVTSITDYCGNFVFEDGKLVKYLFDGGYCSFDVNLNPTYHYYEKDHLGSVRMVVNENGTIEQVNHYYPFGGLYGDLSYNSESQRNKYIGKEFDHTFGLDLYDHGARMYDAARGGWDRADKLSEKFYNMNLYMYVKGNPVKFLDKNGNAPGDFFFTMDEAALDFGNYYNGVSIKENREYASTIYEVWDRVHGKGYSYSVANVGEKASSHFSYSYVFYPIVANIHTHGAYSDDAYYDNTFSGLRRNGQLVCSDERKNIRGNNDVGWANVHNRTSYLVTPNGSLQKYIPSDGKILIVSNDMPCDSNDPDRLNDNIIVTISINAQNRDLIEYLINLFGKFY